MNPNRGHADPIADRMLDAATRRGGSTARSRNNAGGRQSGLPFGFGREGTHCVVAPLAQGGTLSVAARLALHPFSPERAPCLGS